jgi:hypothetical protein
MTDYNVQQALEALREELQSDRQDMQRALTSGFTILNERLDKHAQSHAEITERLVVVEDRQDWMSKGLWGMFIAVIGSFGTFLFHK